MSDVTGLTVGAGAQRWRVERPFFAHAGPGRVSDVAVDADGRVHVLLRSDPLVAPEPQPVIVLAPDGQELARWGAEVADGHMLAAHPDGRVFVVDRDRHRILIFREGTVVGQLGEADTPMAPFNHPCALAFAPDGTIYVADGYANARIHRFAPDGTAMGGWGSHGRGPGEFRAPHDVAVLPDRTVAVADRENDRVQIFSTDGTLLSIVPDLYKPMGLHADAAGRLYATDRVPAMTVATGDGAVTGRCRPVLNGAHGLDGAADGTLYLAEMDPSRVTRLVPLAA